MSRRGSFRRDTVYRREEELERQGKLAEDESRPALSPEEREMRKYEARRKITRMVLIRLLMCAMLLWTAFWFSMPVAMRILLVAVAVLILGTLVPVLTTLKTTLKYEDE